MKLFITKQTSIAKVEVVEDCAKVIHILKKSAPFFVTIKTEGFSLQKYPPKVQLVVNETEHRVVEPFKDDVTSIEQKLKSINSSFTEAVLSLRINVLNSKYEGVYFQVKVFCRTENGECISAFSEPLQVVSKLTQAKRFVDRMLLKSGKKDDNLEIVAKCDLSSPKTATHKRTRSQLSEDEQDETPQISTPSSISSSDTIQAILELQNCQQKQLEMLEKLVDAAARSSSVETVDQSQELSSSTDDNIFLFPDLPDRLSSTQDPFHNGLLFTEDAHVHQTDSRSLERNFFVLLRAFQVLSPEERKKQIAQIFGKADLQILDVWSEFLQVWAETNPNVSITTKKRKVSNTGTDYDNLFLKLFDD